MRLAIRATLTMAVAMLVVSTVSVLVLRRVLDGEIDATIMAVATIQAASLTDEPTGAMHFHDWELSPDEAMSVQDLVRYAQVWSAEGESLLRSEYMTEDLPLDSLPLARAANGELAWTTARFGSLPVRVLYYPLERLGAVHERHVLQVAGPLRARNELLGRVGIFLAALSLAVTGFTFGVSWWLAGRAVRPVHEVIDQAEAIRAESLERPIVAYADTREYQRLVEVLNSMLGRIKSAFDVQRQFAADASHELRSPLTAMRGELELALRRERDVPEYRRALSSTLEEVVRLSRITEDLLFLARSDAGALMVRLETTDLAELARSEVERLRSSAAAKAVDIHVRSGDDATAELDPVLVGQVVSNLVENAIRFVPYGGWIGVAVDGDESSVTLVVEDDGPGFPADVLDRVFDRFFRADRARSRAQGSGGSGLGLAIVRGVVEAHAGRVEARNRPEGGASVTVRLPKRAADAT
jgi:two-component system OmpR family sensor kinase